MKIKSNTEAALNWCHRQIIINLENLEDFLELFCKKCFFINRNTAPQSPLVRGRSDDGGKETVSLQADFIIHLGEFV
jgi:hypothetical protein